jgi:hypothetical protein
MNKRDGQLLRPQVMASYNWLPAVVFAQLVVSCCDHAIGGQLLRPRSWRSGVATTESTTTRIIQ